MNQCWCTIANMFLMISSNWTILLMRKLMFSIMKWLNIITVTISANQRSLVLEFLCSRHILPKFLMLGQWIVRNFKLTNDLQKSNLFVMWLSRISYYKQIRSDNALPVNWINCNGWVICFLGSVISVPR